MEWVLGLLGLVVGGGGVFGYLAARGQLDLEKTKHRDALDEPKRRHALETLQTAAAALEGTIGALQRASSDVSAATNIAIHAARVFASHGAVESLAPYASFSYAAAERALAEFRKVPSLGREQVVRHLQRAAQEIHDAIQRL